MWIKLKQDHFFFFALFILIFYFFKNAFNINFFSDDFYYLRSSQIHSLSDFLNFFSPFYNSFYRPIPGQIFYFLMSIFNHNLQIMHFFILAVFCIGIYYLYLVVYLLTKNKAVSKLTVILYAFSFIHVFQLYWIAQFQEVALYTFLVVSTCLFLKKRVKLSLLFFFFALLSKETAALFPIFLVFLSFLNQKTNLQKKVITLLPFILITFIFLVIYKFGVAQVTTLEIYKIRLNPRLIMNNLMWYFMWSLGLPNFFPDYIMSIFKPPMPKFWEHFKIFEFKVYFVTLIEYFLIFASSLTIFMIKYRKSIKSVFFTGLLSFSFFVIFVSPTLPILHKWMVRLTIPLIFISFFQAYILDLYFKKKNPIFNIFGLLLISLFIVWNYYGTNLHESSSTYMLETKLVNNMNKYVNKNRSKIQNAEIIYFQDPPAGKGNPWGGSEKLKVTLHDQNFLKFYFPNRNIKAIYEFEDKTIPPQSYILKTLDITSDK